MIAIRRGVVDLRVLGVRDQNLLRFDRCWVPPLPVLLTSRRNKKARLKCAGKFTLTKRVHHNAQLRHQGRIAAVLRRSHRFLPGLLAAAMVASGNAEVAHQNGRMKSIRPVACAATHA
jgi:hypothetical protein